MTLHDPNIPEWAIGDGPDADIVISTRARLARSLASFPFPSRASGEDLSMVVRNVRSASVGLIERFPNLKALSVEKLSKQERSYLLDAHVASVELMMGGEGKIIILEPSANLSIMVNEEDHIRVQTLMSGFVPEKAWDTADWVDDVLSKKLEYGFTEKYGYLTASVSNVGTGLRISAMMHLVGLAMKRKLNAQLRAAYDLGVSIRGLFGEGSQSVGDLFQVSNEMTLGISETEIVERVRAVTQYILDEERVARRELLNEERSRLIENTLQSLMRLNSVELITAREAITLMSQVRLAAEVGLVKNCSRCLLNQLLMGMRVGAGEDDRTCIERADLIKRKLAGIDLVSS